MSSWQSYKCFGLNYRMVAIESLDSDTETRRLSPVAVLGDGFVDLINGKVLVVLPGRSGGRRVFIVCCWRRPSGSRLVCRIHLPAPSVSVPQHHGHRTRLRRLLHQRQPAEASPADAQLRPV